MGLEIKYTQEYWFNKYIYVKIYIFYRELLFFNLKLSLLYMVFYSDNSLIPTIQFIVHGSL